MSNLHEFSANRIDGTDSSLSEFEGQVVLVVNVASKCGFTPQYEGLEAIHAKYEGLSVLGFPCNQFGAQEPGSESEIQTFCTTNFGVSFPMFAKVDVNGAEAHPAFAWLTAQESSPIGAGDIKWNFEKFLVGKSGQVIGRFGSAATPEGAELAEAITSAL